ncbi:oxidoreductase domain-containing protein [Beauveria bassiana ARSEF 2860]|uniref:D-xylose 1-dehydrogenase (NADP(+), D-xylono-1,5-lactone-forming) n=1 Tax=Beauveria bassiana (strain ARSEF 2860) TaxID=655819 RepID=J4KR18_BEAB2|nr:oxidoreductase domain-containing protein [Beauveria bassiana ARSEF 2860]EJP70179.1 oxidoreductase domain-containing protein [Beauveria bassiana ARSEF 2860]
MLRWGILGTSFISDVVAKAILASDASHIQAVFGRDEQRLSAFADRYGIASRYTSLEALLADPAVDAVYVGLPSHKHAEAVILAARAGGKRAILSEKSLATTMTDARAMMDAVRAAAAAAADHDAFFFLEGLMYLTHPIMEMLVAVLAEGRLGRIRSVSGHYAANIAAKANPRGRGTIYNLGCYPVSLLHLVLETCFARNGGGDGDGGAQAWNGRRTVLGHGTLATSDDGVTFARDAALTVRFEDVDVLATLQSSDSFGNDFAFAIQGDRASLTFETNPWLPPAGDSVFRIKTYKSGAVETVTVPSSMDAFGHQIKKVEAYVASGVREPARPSPTWANSLEIMELLTEWEEDIFKRHGKEIQV